MRLRNDHGTNENVGSNGVFVGRLSAEKGMDVLLRALHRAGDPPFLVVGDGPSMDELVALSRALGLVNTKFLGWRSEDEVGALMAAARYVAIPSIWEETASLSALEALRAARPLLVSDRGALPELVSTGAGLVFRPGDADELAGKIRRLMQDEELCRRASAEAVKLADEMVTPQRYIARLEAIYREVSTTA